MDFEAEQIDIDELYSGIRELLDQRRRRRHVLRAEHAGARPDASYKANQYVLLRDRDNPSHSALGRFDGAGEEAGAAAQAARGRVGHPPAQQGAALRARSAAQRRHQAGHAGRQGRHRQDAAGDRRRPAEGASRSSVYSKLLVSRPIFPLGRDIGYLPGDIEEKLNPWMQPIYDNVEFLMGLSKTERKNGRSYQELIDLGYIEIEPLTYIRGRSIPNQFIIVDEAQNLTPHEVKTIITRVGEETKVVLTGDPYQIDNPYVDATVERPHHRRREVQGRGRSPAT